MQRLAGTLGVALVVLIGFAPTSWPHIDATQRMGPYNVTVSIASVAEIDGDGTEINQLTPGDYYLRAFVLDGAFQPVGDLQVSLALRHDGALQDTLELAYQGEGGEYRARGSLDQTGDWSTEVRLSAPGAAEPLTAGFDWEVAPAAGPLDSLWLWGLGAFGVVLLLLAGALFRWRARRAG